MNWKTRWNQIRLLSLCLLFLAGCSLSLFSTIEAGAVSANTEKQGEQEGAEDTTASGGELQGQKEVYFSISLRNNNPSYTGEQVDGDLFLNVIVKEKGSGKEVKNPELYYTYYSRVLGEEAPIESNYLKEPPVDVGYYWVEVRYKGDATHRAAYSKPVQFRINPATPEVLVTTNMTENSCVGDTIKITTQLRIKETGKIISNPYGKITYYANDELINTVSFKNGKAVVEYVLPAEEVTIAARYAPGRLNGMEENYEVAVGSIRGIKAKKRAQEELTAFTTHKIYGSKPFKLDITGGGGSGAYSYESSNKKVATVAKDGTITIVHPGTTYITVTKAGDDSYQEAKVKYKLVVGKGVNPEQVKNVVKKDVTSNQIEVHTVKGQEYSIDGGTTWNTTGVFKKLKANKEYTVLTRLSETEYYAASSKTSYLKLSTDKAKLDKVEPSESQNTNNSQPGSNLGQGSVSLGGHHKNEQITTANRIDSSTVDSDDEEIRDVLTLGKNNNTSSKVDGSGKPSQNALKESEGSKESSSAAESEESSAAEESSEEETTLSEEESKEQAEQEEQQMHASTSSVKVGMTVLILALGALTVIYFSKRETNL